MTPRSSESVRVRLGDTFEINEPSNPTTGHKWTPIFDPSLLELKAEKYERSPGMIGGGGKQKFTFLAKKRGKVVIQLEYKRPWEGSPEKRLDFEVTVE